MTYRHALAIALLGTGLSFPGHAEAKTDVLAYEVTGLQSDLFGVIDLTTGVFTPRGSMGQTLAGLGSYGGQIYGAAYAGETLYMVNTSTGALTAIGSTGVELVDFGSTKKGLYGFGITGNLYSINPATGAASLIGPTGLSFGGIVVMGMSAGANKLFLTQDNLLYVLSTKTGSATLIGTVATDESGFGALVAIGGKLYAGAYSPSNTPDLYTLNRKDAVATFLSSSSSTPDVPGVAGFWGLAPIPAVPEPPTWFMMLCGFAGLALVANRQRRILCL
jgi:hypothetical protein